MTRKSLMLITSAALSLTLAACGGGGGGGGGGVNSMPPPPVTPTPTPTPTPTSSAVDIFQNPATQEFAAAGVGDSLRIRYDAASDRYEVMAGTRGWEALVDDQNFMPFPGNPNVSFDVSGSPQSFFMIRAHYSYTAPEVQGVQYHYSNLANWGIPGPGGQSGLNGITAFGMATPPGGVPVTGSASYQGMIEGRSTITGPWDWDEFGSWVDGSVLLNFNFGTGSLAGELHPYLHASTRQDLGTLAFANTIFGAGSQTFSGSFATSVSGPNSFSGQFTGPNAEELIGKWAFPFLSPIDGSPHSAAGAWIAKRGP